MYRDLRQFFWWNNTKKEITQYIDKCPICRKVKAEHQCPIGELQPLEIPTCTWDSISMVFVMGLSFSTSKKDIIWEVVYRLSKYAPFSTNFGYLGS